MFEEATKELESINIQQVEAGKRLIKSCLLEFMAAHPEVGALKWLQYAPSFNDGDPCVFSVHEPEVRFATGDVAASDESSDDDDEDEDEDEEDGEFIDCWSFDETPAMERLKADVQSLYAVIQAAENAAQELFGEGSRVVVGRDGEAKVSEYYE